MLQMPPDRTSDRLLRQRGAPAEHPVDLGSAGQQVLRALKRQREILRHRLPAGPHESGLVSGRVQDLPGPPEDRACDRFACIEHLPCDAAVSERERDSPAMSPAYSPFG